MAVSLRIFVVCAILTPHALQDKGGPTEPQSALSRGLRGQNPAPTTGISPEEPSTSDPSNAEVRMEEPQGTGPKMPGLAPEPSYGGPSSIRESVLLLWDTSTRVLNHRPHLRRGKKAPQTHRGTRKPLHMATQAGVPQKRISFALLQLQLLSGTLRVLSSPSNPTLVLEVLR